jgi:ATP-dependent RNA helicase DDX6/DHH1
MCSVKQDTMHRTKSSHSLQYCEDRETKECGRVGLKRRVWPTVAEELSSLFSAYPRKYPPSSERLIARISTNVSINALILHSTVSISPISFYPASLSPFSRQSPPDNWRSGLCAPPRDDRPQTEDVKGTLGLEFEDMFLRRELLMGIFEAGFEKPSPIQEEAIPVALTKRDILARAKNGTGKTAAFVIPALQQIDITKNKIQSLLLVPTRELALQTSQVCKTLGKHMGVQVMVTTGGTTLKDDILRLSETVHVLVGTPGRILDLAGKSIADLNECPVFVMDEADKLLSPEFSPVMEQLLSYLPKTRQVMLFSATFPLIVKDFKVRPRLACHLQQPTECQIGQTYEHST